MYVDGPPYTLIVEQHVPEIKYLRNNSFVERFRTFCCTPLKVELGIPVLHRQPDHCLIARRYNHGRRVPLAELAKEQGAIRIPVIYFNVIHAV